MFSIRQVIEALCAYEATHDTGRYVVNGWPVWPFVRIHAAGSKVYAQIEKAADVSQSTEPARHYFPDRLNVARTAAAACVDSVRSPVVPCDVLFLSNSSRRQYYRGRAIQYICDPLADEFAKRGVACSTWQAGLPVSGAYREEIPLRNRLHFLMWKARKTRAGSWIPPEEPEWFREFQVFMQDNLEFQPDWGEYARAISNITIMSRVMERWLNQARPKLVCVDCWYGWAPLAAVIAARRMDIRVCDIQHGIQEFGHYAYHGWKEAYCSMPDSYWVWGERAAGLIKGGPGDFAVLQGGNLWLNMWRSNSSAFVREERDRVRKIVAGRRSTLVTLANPTRVFLERAFRLSKRCRKTGSSFSGCILPRRPRIGRTRQMRSKKPVSRTYFSGKERICRFTLSSRKPTFTSPLILLARMKLLPLKNLQ